MATHQLKPAAIGWDRAGTAASAIVTSAESTSAEAPPTDPNAPPAAPNAPPTDRNAPPTAGALSASGLCAAATSGARARRGRWLARDTNTAAQAGAVFLHHGKANRVEATTAYLYPPSRRAAAGGKWGPAALSHPRGGDFTAALVVGTHLLQPPLCGSALSCSNAGTCHPQPLSHLGPSSSATVMAQTHRFSLPHVRAAYSRGRRAVQVTVSWSGLNVAVDPAADPSASTAPYMAPSDSCKALHGPKMLSRRGHWKSMCCQETEPHLPAVPLPGSPLLTCCPLRALAAVQGQDRDCTPAAILYLHVSYTLHGSNPTAVHLHVCNVQTCCELSPPLKECHERKPFQNSLCRLL